MTKEQSRFQNTLQAWIAATLLPGCGAVRFSQYLAQGVCLPDLLATDTALPERMPQAMQAAIRGYRAQDALFKRSRELLNQAEQAGWRVVPLTSADYPALLREITDPPPLLWVDGNLDALHMPQLAMVGSRNASREGVQLAHLFARDFAAAGLTVTSGLALGIDGAAHQGALEGQGCTVAVVGTGLDQVYPRRHQGLAAAIKAQQGAIVSELVPGTGPVSYNFPRRNRIISGLSCGVLVVEAALKSGSLITARQASEQGRTVFAVPGSIHNPMSRGCHALIREGATLVETIQHIVDDLRPMLAMLRESLSDQPVAETAPSQNRLDIAEYPASLSPEARHLLLELPFAPIEFDQLAALQTQNLPTATLQMLLMELEMEALLELQGSQILRRR